LALSLSRAVNSPTPLSAACEAVGLMAGPSRPLPAGICRVRSFRPVRPLPAGSGHAGRGADTPAMLHRRVGTVTTGTAPAFDRTLAPCYGSDLLSLRLRLRCSWVTRFFAPPQVGAFASFARPARSPRARLRCALLPRGEKPFGGVVPPGNVLACWLSSSSRNPLGNWISKGVETSPRPDLARTRFLIAPCHSAPDSHD